MTKHEILLRKKTYEFAYAKKFIKKITNNYYECNFDNNLDFFISMMVIKFQWIQVFI